MDLWLHKSLICSIISVQKTTTKHSLCNHTTSLPEFWRYASLFFSQKIFNSSGNLHHCGRAPLCSDVEFIAISLFQEHCSIDSERRFFTELKTMLPEQSLKIGSRRNYNARKHRLDHYIEQLRRAICLS